MSSFYKMDPAAWDFGTSGLSLEEEAAYLRIVNAICKHDAPVPHNDRVLAGMFRCSTRKARALLSALIDAGKVFIEDGKIWNERARSELVQRQLASISASESGAKGGRKSGEARRKSLKENNRPQADPSTRIEENRIEPPLPPKGDDDEPDRFDEFWSVYPHRNGQKKGKKPARLKWNAARKRGVSQQTMIDGARASHSMPDVKRGFPRDPVTWINQEGWDDDPGTARDSPGAPAFHFERFDRKSA